MNYLNAPRQSKLTSALLSTVITVLVVSSIVIGMTSGGTTAQPVAMAQGNPAAVQG